MNWETYHSIANEFFVEILKTTLADWNVVSLLMYTVTNEINSEFCPQPIRVGHILNETISFCDVVLVSIFRANSWQRMFNIDIVTNIKCPSSRFEGHLWEQHGLIFL